MFKEKQTYEMISSRHVTLKKHFIKDMVYSRNNCAWLKNETMRSWYILFMIGFIHGMIHVWTAHQIHSNNSGQGLFKTSFTYHHSQRLMFHNSESVGNPCIKTWNCFRKISKTLRGMIHSRWWMNNSRHQILSDDVKCDVKDYSSMRRNTCMSNGSFCDMNRQICIISRPGHTSQSGLSISIQSYALTLVYMMLVLDDTSHVTNP